MRYFVSFLFGSSMQSVLTNVFAEGKIIMHARFRLMSILFIAIIALLLHIVPFSELHAQRNAQLYSTQLETDSITDATDDQNVQPNAEPYIIGGEQAQPGEFPWIVRFLSYDTLGSLNCAGSIIHPEWILTAGHCAGTVYQVTAGAHDLRLGGDTNRVVLSVDRVIRHHLYNDYSLDNDIALLHLSQPVALNDRIQVLPLISSPTDDSLLESGKMSTVAGWGYVTENGPSVSILRKVDLPLINNTVCQDANTDEVTDNMMCAGYPQGAKDACAGDSGGALMVTDGAGNKKLAGIVSWGDGCARPDAYGIYTRVSQYFDWIDLYVDWESVSDIVSPTPTTVIQPGIPTPTVTPIAPPSEGIGNRDFEEGSDDMWAEHSQQSYVLITGVSPVDPWSGDYLAWLGGTNDEISNLMQTIQLPEAESIELTYSYQIFSHDSCGRDNARFLVNNKIMKNYNLCKAKATVGWAKESLDLSEYAGQRVTFRFYAKTDPRRFSSLMVDDLELTYSVSIPDSPHQLVGILNGDFEQGGSGDWFESSTFFGEQLSAIIVSAADVPSLTQEGNDEYLAWLGGLKDEISRLQQQVILPDVSPLYLNYRYAIESDETSCSQDITRVLVDGITVYEHGLCYQNATSGWYENTIDLSNYAGQSVPLEFWSSTDSVNLSSFYLDEIELVLPPTNSRADTRTEDEFTIFLPLIQR